jgi:hypothetical protein
LQTSSAKKSAVQVRLDKVLLGKTLALGRRRQTGERTRAGKPFERKLPGKMID